MNKEAPELSPEARRIISEARGCDDPTPDDQARVKARWLAGVAAVAGVSSLTEAARAAGGIGWGLKAAGAALVLAAGAIGLNLVLSGEDASQAQKSGAPRATARPGWSGTTHARFEKTLAGAARSAEKPEAEKAATTEPEGPASSAPAAPSVGAEGVEVGGALAEPGVADPAPAAEPGAVALGATEALEATAATAALEATAQLEPKQQQNNPSQASHANPLAAPAPGVSELPAPATGAAAAGAGGRERPARTAVTRSAVARSNATKQGNERSPAPQARLSPASAPTAGSAPAAAQAGGQLSEELALLSDVRRSVHEGDPNRALELLARHEARFGQPILGMEADALRVDALCKAGQREAARASARAFQNEWPGSPLERRVSTACP